MDERIDKKIEELEQRLQTFHSDFIEQFRGKPHIEGLVRVIERQFRDLYAFYVQLRDELNVNDAVGKQLDGEGDIVVMTRKEAGELAGNPIPFDVIDDDTYRQYLIYKILKNTCDCTYPNIIKAFRMFWDKPLYYSEDPEQPATIIFDTGEMSADTITTPLFKVPLIRAAGVTLKLYARTTADMGVANVPIASGLGYAVTVTTLPYLERLIDYGAKVHVKTGVATVAEDTLPGIEREYKFSHKLRLGSGVQSVSQDRLPFVEREISYSANVDAGSGVYSIMETPINGIQQQ